LDTIQKDQIGIYSYKILTIQFSINKRYSRSPKMLDLNIPYKQVSRIEGYEEFVGYYIDINGNVWSTKGKSPRIIRPFYAGKKTKKYNKVCLCNEGKCVYVYVHILMAKAFIPDENRKKYVMHLTSNSQDNRLDNLITSDTRLGFVGKVTGRPKKDGSPRVVSKGKGREEKVKEVEKKFLISDDIFEKVKLVYKASIIKGLPVSDSYGFLEEIIEELLDEYCTRKGLRRIIHQLGQDNI
jgi:hypothetical protein